MLATGIPLPRPTPKQGGLGTWGSNPCCGVRNSYLHSGLSGRGKHMEVFMTAPSISEVEIELGKDVIPPGRSCNE